MVPAAGMVDTTFVHVPAVVAVPAPGPLVE